jgi:hypothetical protein
VWQHLCLAPIRPSPYQGEARWWFSQRTPTYPSSPLMFALHYPPPHHPGTTGGAAATSGRGDAIAGASLLLRVRVAAVGDERSPARLPNHSKNWQPRDDYRLTTYYLRGDSRLGVRSFSSHHRTRGGASARPLPSRRSCPISPMRLTARQRDFTHEAGFSISRKSIRWRATAARLRGGINR